MERVWGAPDLLRLAGVLALSLLFFGVSAPAWAAPLRVGLDSNYPPFSLVDRRGHASGFDLEVAEELCRAHGPPMRIRLPAAGRTAREHAQRRARPFAGGQ